VRDFPGKIIAKHGIKQSQKNLNQYFILKQQFSPQNKNLRINTDIGLSSRNNINQVLSP
jgi:hypothetical protein